MLRMMFVCHVNIQCPDTGYIYVSGLSRFCHGNSLLAGNRPKKL